MKSIIISLLTSLSTFTLAQVRVSGKVVDEAGASLVGANIVIKDTYDGASTDAWVCLRSSLRKVGQRVLVVTSISYELAEREIDLRGDIDVVITLREVFNELDAVVISAGSFTAGEEKRRTILRAIDIATTAGATADIAGALNTLPGTTKVGETGRLFVRGGDDSESRTFIDGMVALNPYNASAPNTPTRTRSMPFMFKGTSFSTGGYSAEYGQALSSALVLASKDKTEMNQTDIGMLSVGGEVAHSQVFKKSSIAGKVGYTTLSPYYQIIRQRLDWKDPYESWDGNVAFRQQIGDNGGYLKVYGKYTNANFSYYEPTIENPSDKYLYEIDNVYGYGNVAYLQPLSERWLVRGGLSYTYNDNDMRIGGIPLREQEKCIHAKAVFENTLSDKVELRLGSEIIFRHYEASSYDSLSGQNRSAAFEESITAIFVESEVYLSERVVTRAGLRLEYNSLQQEAAVDPRVSIAYRPFDKGQFSFAYGTFRQSPGNEYMRINQALTNERAHHYIVNYQLITDNRTFRVEAYYKKYFDLVKYGDPDQTFLTNEGDGFARGAEVFWRDNKSIKNVDYWISYSFLDTKRNYLNYPSAAMPTFASKHNFNTALRQATTAYMHRAPSHNPRNTFCLLVSSPRYPKTSL